LWYRTQPPTQLDFAKDSGDLFYVRAKTWKIPMISLEFGTDGSLDYFGGEIPRGVLATMYPVQERPKVPAGVKKIAQRHLRQFGIERGMALHEVLYRIIPYLRSFVARKLKSHEYRDNAFSTLWLSRVGVCRHRATLFVLALQSLGFPARMVANQAHAFAEVQYPDRQWRQIDLGGGEIPHWMGQWHGRRFQPPQDPFPEPPPNPHALKRPPVTPNPPPHDDSLPSSASRQRLDQSRGVSPSRGASKHTQQEDEPDTRFGRSQGKAARTSQSIRRGSPTRRTFVRRVKKARKLYLPHTRF
jgi:hypothetical protein